MTMDTRIDDKLIEDVCAIEKLFKDAGLDLHALAIKIALNDAIDDAMHENFYGTAKIKENIRAANNIYQSFSEDYSKFTNNKIIDILNSHMEDISMIQDVNNAPKFVKASSGRVLEALQNLISHIKPQNPGLKIDKTTIELIEKLKETAGGSPDGQNYRTG